MPRPEEHKGVGRSKGWAEMGARAKGGVEQEQGLNWGQEWLMGAEHYCVPGPEECKGRLVRGVPLLQGSRQLEADGGVQLVHAGAQVGQPGMQPSMHCHGLCARLPLLHCSTQLHHQELSVSQTLGSPLSCCSKRFT